MVYGKPKPVEVDNPEEKVQMPVMVKLEQKKTEVIEEPLKPNEFICETCTFKNCFNKERLDTADCEMCGTKNEELYLRIQKHMEKKQGRC